MADGFFAASKIVGFLLAPSSALAVALALGLALQVWPRTRRLGRSAALGAGLSIAILGLTPIGDAGVATLERRLPAVPICATGEQGPAVTGIILLGGGLGAITVEGRVEPSFNDASDRMHHAANLAKAWPDAPVLVSGGRAFPRPGAPSEAQAMAATLMALGVAPHRLQLETQSRTTAENAARLAEAAPDPKSPGAYLLVTSAFHMPRAVATFRAAGLEVAPAPTDWRVDEARPAWTGSVADNLRQVDLATKEALGLIAYRVSGRTRSLWPDPEAGPACVVQATQRGGAVAPPQGG